LIDGQVFEIENQTSDYTSKVFGWRNGQQHQKEHRTVYVILKGPFSASIKLEVSPNQEDWFTLPGAEKNEVTEQNGAARFVVACGNDRYWRVVITHISGSYNAKGYLN
jgi:hypothetical protein